MVKMIGELIDRLPSAELIGDPETLIHDLRFDSREVRPGTLFAALRGGYTDGHRFLHTARDAGAIAALVEPETPAAEVVGYAAVVRVANTRAALAQVAAHWFDDPSRALTLVGVTGTDGKTTTSYLIEAMLSANGLPTGLIGTVAIRVPGQPERSAARQTTPESLDVQRYLAEMRDARARVAVLEATSHGLETHRVDGCEFDVGVLTNVTHEHLDFHGSVEQYRIAKAGLLRRVVAAQAQGKRAVGVLNRDDEGTRAISSAGQGARLFWYSAQGDPAADLIAADVQVRSDGTSFRLQMPSGDAHVALHLPGRWNVSNALAAASVGCALGLSPQQIADGLASLGAVPGRMETVDAGQPFTVLVDYAHTPEALRAVLSEARNLTSGRVLTLFGSAGERDLEKRAIQGAVAQELAEFAIFTSEDPRFEDADAIIAEIAAGAEQAGGRRGVDFDCIEDRRDAIFELISRARPGDVVILAGKGHERSMIYGDTQRAWDESAVAREALAVSWRGAGL